MLSMVIFRFNPERKEEVLRRRLEEEPIFEVNNVGEWCSIEAGQVFRLVEGMNLQSALEAFRTWGHLGNIEIVPVERVDEVIRYL
jgi:hypothetical protein